MYIKKRICVRVRERRYDITNERDMTKGTRVATIIR